MKLKIKFSTIPWYVYIRRGICLLPLTISAIVYIASIWAGWGRKEAEKEVRNMLQ